jgi:hypothetical protein
MKVWTALGEIFKGLCLSRKAVCFFFFRGLPQEGMPIKCQPFSVLILDLFALDP